MKQSNLTTPRTMQDQDKDNGRKVIPIHTGKVQIGLCYQPKPTAAQAMCIERHTKSKRQPSGYYKWAGWVAFSLFCVIFLSVRGA